jgi:hypothetical protein
VKSDANPHRATVQPWHREPWPWILLSLPLGAVVAGIITLVIAIDNEDGLVAQDYYKRGLEINRVLEKETRAGALGVRAELVFADAGIGASLSQPRPPAPALTLRFVHPTRSGEDRQLTLALAPDGVYRAERPALAAGRWLVQLEDGQRGWRLTGVWRTEDAVLALSPQSTVEEGR